MCLSRQNTATLMIMAMSPSQSLIRMATERGRLLRLRPEVSHLRKLSHKEEGTENALTLCMVTLLPLEPVLFRLRRKCKQRVRRHSTGALVHLP